MLLLNSRLYLDFASFLLMSFFFGGGVCGWRQAFYFKKIINFQYPNSYTIGFPFSQLAPQETTPKEKAHT